MSEPQGVHLVGSLPFDDATTTIRTAAAILGGRLKRIPDGETGERIQWINFQTSRIAATPGFERVGDQPVIVQGGFDVRPLRIKEGVDPQSLVLPSLGYADSALASWKTFSALRDAGEVRAGTRFQVALPTPASVVGAWVAPESRAAFEPVYAAALFGELDRILAGIPHDSLAIQWDTAVEFGFIEHAGYRGPFEAWFDDIWGGVIDRAVDQASRVPDDVELGFHLCYGDAGNAHFVEPTDSGNLVTFANLLLERSPRRIDFIHLPVPIDRDDDAYFAPLESLAASEGTEIYLGLIHREDGVEGAHRRSVTAQRHLAHFGVGTECGFGRTPREFTIPVLEVHRDAALAW